MSALLWLSALDVYTAGAECRGWPIGASIESPFGEFYCKVRTAGNHSPVTLTSYRTPPRTPIVIISQRDWAGKLCLRLWHKAGHVAKYECSQPVVLFSDSVSVITVKNRTEPQNPDNLP